MYAAEADEPVVPCDPLALGGLKAVDGALGDGELDAGNAFSVVFWTWRRALAPDMACPFLEPGKAVRASSGSGRPSVSPG